MAERLLTERLILRPWEPDDAGAALGAYGDNEVARWLTPVMDRVRDEAAMRVVLQQWVAEDTRMRTPAGRWVGETEKYHHLRLQVFRLRPGDLTTRDP